MPSNKAFTRAEVEQAFADEGLPLEGTFEARPPVFGQAKDRKAFEGLEDLSVLLTSRREQDKELGLSLIIFKSVSTAKRQAAFAESYIVSNGGKVGCRLGYKTGCVIVRGNVVITYSALPSSARKVEAALEALK